nr:tyrosine-type recombinase/integrase [uncultured Desulfobulbus sp.]
MAILKHFQEQAQKRSGNAANKDRKNLSAAWNWGRDYIGLPYENPFQRTTKQGEVRHERRIPTLSEFWKVYEKTTELQDKRMLLCYLYSGARRAEFFQLRWQDVDFINGRIRLHWKKNRLGTLNAAWIAMTDEAMEALRDQHRATGSCKWVFVEPGTALPYQVPHAMDAAFMQAGRSGKIWFSWNTPFVRVDLGE